MLPIAKILALHTQTLDLARAGEPETARRLAEAYLANYQEHPRSQRASSEDLARLNYFLTYIQLPELLFTSWELFEKLWDAPLPISLYLALLRASDLQLHLTTPQIHAYLQTQGKLRNGSNYYLITFPTPPANQPNHRPILGPYYLAVVRGPDIAPCVYVLAQSPASWTTLRLVEAEGRNSNLGIGPEPSLAGFLRAIDEHLKG